MITATVTSKGQITIPTEIRQALKLGAGDRIAFEMAPAGGYIFKPAQKMAATALKGMFGKPAKAVSIEDMNAAIAKRGASAASVK
jgi:AbrB family looped-hinge helix DNA binding protein